VNTSTFLRHHGLGSNPFSAEEARQDDVFARLEDSFHHPDFDKMCGDFSRPSTSVVFGERGSGKTAIRLQMLHRLRAHNATERGHQVMGVAYDDFDAIIGSVARHAAGGSTARAVMELTLADHVDALLGLATPALVDAAMGRPSSGAAAPIDLGAEPTRTIRALDRRHREHFLLLQSLYDRAEELPGRTRRLRRALRLPGGDRTRPLLAAGGACAAVGLALLVLSLLSPPESRVWAWNAAIGLLMALAAGFAGWGGWLWLRRWRLGRSLARALRALGREGKTCREALGALPAGVAERSPLPRGSDEEPRFALLGHFMELLGALGIRGLVVIVDRVDEPTSIAGDPTRMRALVWPMLSSKLLQFPGVGMKLLLPAELRPMLAREAGEFFRGARLDKQNLIERLVWPGATLYDLCTARMEACRLREPSQRPPEVAQSAELSSESDRTTRPAAAANSLADLFDESVRAQDLVDALDQFQQPRDAFKFVYQCIQEHCGAVPEQAPLWRIPRALLDAVRKREVQRMQDMLKGARAG
jgi:hypothetical protein